eukprot:768607-Hanusia_phi.AAC.4
MVLVYSSTGLVRDRTSEGARTRGVGVGANHYRNAVCSSMRMSRLEQYLKWDRVSPSTRELLIRASIQAAGTECSPGFN